MSTKNKVLFSVLSLPLSLTFSYIFASLFSDNAVTYINFISQTPRFYICFFSILLITLSLSYALIFTGLGKKAHEFFDMFEGKAKPEPLMLLLAAFTAYLFFHIAYDGPIDDYMPHTRFALEFDWSSLWKSICVLPHPLWHSVVSFSVKVFHCSPMFARSVSTAFFCTLTFVFTRAILLVYLDSVKHKYVISDVFAFIIMFMQPLYIKWFNPHPIVGQGSPFMLHNPTNLTVQPFALICLFLLLNILKKKISLKTEPTFTDYARLGLFSLISSFAKPSFLQVFLPATCIFLVVWLIKNKRFDFKFCLKLALAFTPSVINILRVMIVEFFIPSEDAGGIALSFFNVWMCHSPFVPVSIILGAGYCLFYVLMKNRGMGDITATQMIVLCWICGILEFGLLMETGERQYHGNFSWGYCISLSMMYVYITADLLSNIFKKRFCIKNLGTSEWIGILLLGVQFVQGVNYFIGII